MAALDGSHLFRIQRTFALEDRDARITTIASHATERRQLQALAISADGHADGDRALAHFLVVRSVEEDRRVRHWRFPLAVSHAKQDQHRVEPVSALAFSPEGDWLACLARRKNRLHLVPVAMLIADHRRAQLARAYHPSHNREWMGVAPSVMTIPMASYLRATNEGGGLNGARYGSRVAGDDAQMSTLEFAVGMGVVTCCRWWRSMNGKTYCLVGGTDNLISIVNAQENAEECRCELQNAGGIESIELFYETFRKEKRTSMLVKTRARDDKTGEETVKYFRVVLEKRTVVEKSKADDTKRTLATDATTNANATDSTQSSASSASSTFTTTFVARPAAVDTYAIKTFPEHFVEDLDFRPQRVKKTKPDIRLRAINGLLSTESGLAMYDAKQRRVSVYSNFQWTLKGQYSLPTLLGENLSSEDEDSITDIDIVYCSADLMLLQGTTVRSKKSIATWISLPSRPDIHDDDTHSGDEEAHIVHQLTLHDGERVENVLQSTRTPSGTWTAAVDSSQVVQGTDGSGAGEVVYIIQTAHNVYECRPQWSRLALFRALGSRSLALRDALSIGYALGIDMASLCEVVADTLVQDESERTLDPEPTTQLWIHELYRVSRAAPSKIVRQLTKVRAPELAIGFGKQVLFRGQRQTDREERHTMALLVVDLVFKQQVKHNFHSDAQDQLTLRPREPRLQADLESDEAWLIEFLQRREEDAGFESEEMIDLCLRHAQMDKALAVAITRNRVDYFLQRVVESGLGAVLTGIDGRQGLQTLVDAGFAKELLHPSRRTLLRALPVDAQLRVALATKSTARVLRHRDWILRNVHSLPKAICLQLARLVDPDQDEDGDADGKKNDQSSDDEQAQEDILSEDRLRYAVCEELETTPAERVELFLTLLLRLNIDNTDDGLLFPEDDNRFSQRALESHLHSMSARYRPPLLLSRCVDFENWSAAANLHEAHGELVDAVECRLHSHHRRLERVPGVHLRRRQSSKDSLTEDVEDLDKDQAIYEDEAASDTAWRASLQQELCELVESLLVHSSHGVGETTGAAILSRLVSTWFEYGLPREQLEVFLVDQRIFQHVASPLAQIFFNDIVDRVVGGVHGPVFDERDKAWVKRCQRLPFSGQFLLHVCRWFLDDMHRSQPIGSSSLPQVLQTLRENVEKNDLSIRAVRLAPHAASALGKSDPLETHVKVFSCGHVFPKRVFEEDVLPEFEKRLSALPAPLFATRQLLLAEFRRSHVEAPCPVCSLNLISSTIFAARKNAAGITPITAPPSPEDQDDGVYYLHGRSALPSTTAGNSFFAAAVARQQQQQHEEWEWQGASTGSSTIVPTTTA